jgi:ABC-type transporter Mla subunit MlaD
VKREIETIHEIARKSHEDLAAVADRRHEISHDRAEVDRLFQALAAADQKVGEIERRSRTVDEVRRKADAVAHLLEDVHVTLDTLGTQKAMLDEVSERLGGLDAVIAEAQGTTKALQAERKIAQRIVENVRTIHNRANAEIRPAG